MRHIHVICEAVVLLIAIMNEKKNHPTAKTLPDLDEE